MGGNGFRDWVEVDVISKVLRTDSLQYGCLITQSVGIPAHVLPIFGYISRISYKITSPLMLHLPLEKNTFNEDGAGHLDCNVSYQDLTRYGHINRIF